DRTTLMSITAQIVADSVSPQGIRLSTLALKYPRWIHAEFMTHRLFSRNASSSRAVPSKRLRALEREYPLQWDVNIPGMQSGARLSDAQAAKAKAVWDRMADACAAGVAELAEIGLHKQWANRPLEWFTSISVLVSATSFDNFFGVRWHPDAQPEIQELARQMFAALQSSTPRSLEPGDWHLPYVAADEAQSLGLDTARRCSAARCARVSYLNHDGTAPNVAKDLDTFAKLAGDPNAPPQPLHASPLEHQATPDRLTTPDQPASWQFPAQHGNFYGWRQFRKMIAREQIEKFEPPMGQMESEKSEE
ncbi:MAG: FAD-dependent thymidylate synthase, partial [Kiritimatiellia bacterium]|nr:FAD-dependent thymidylate synthase [Kiritimatiellia bacterium]